MTTKTMQPPAARRGFLRRGCLVAAAAGFVIVGGGTFAATYTPPIDFPTHISGDKTMTNRILVAYSSKAGSTAEAAARIGDLLTQQGAVVDVLPVSKASEPGAYQAVVLGSATRMGQPVGEAVKWVEANQAVLQQRPFSAFMLCLTLEPDTEENRKTVATYLDPIRKLVQPQSEAMFAGVMNPQKLSLIERLMMKAMKTPVGDFRKWDQIEAWAKAIPLA
jgi:menaquinone-dependent protoporphyrinogen oxidase